VFPAPIIVTVYDRPHHFRACIESLKSNPEAACTELFISSDGPSCDGSRERVEKVRTYIKGITGFRKVTLFASKENTHREVVNQTKDAVWAENERYIFIEDDNIVSPWFLNFINAGLDTFAENQDVLAVCGYNYPGFPFEKSEAVALRCFAAWGYGIWRDRGFIPDNEMAAYASSIFADTKKFARINGRLPHMAPMLHAMAKGNLIAGDVAICARTFCDNKVCIFPSRSLVRNIGHDGTGQYCEMDERYTTQDILSEPIDVSNSISLDPQGRNTRWLHGFVGGRRKEILGWLLFLEVRIRNPVLNRIGKRLYRMVKRVVKYQKVIK
jgi:hypothetical protein